MNEGQRPNGRNGSWQTWLLTIIGGLILVAIVGAIVFERDTAKMLGEHDVRLKYLESTLTERTTDRFRRADFEREMIVRDRDRERLDRRIQALEQRR